MAQKPIGYLVPQNIVTQNSTILRFENISASLIPIFKWKRGSLPKYCFVSHRWMFQKDPDSSLNTLSLILKIFATVRDDVGYYWIDYMCLPCDQVLEDDFIDLMQDIVYNATELLIVPISASQNSLIPKYDIQTYCFRAWCAYEFSAFMDKPKKITVARVLRREEAMKVKFLGFPCTDKDAKLSNMVNSFVVLKDILFREDAVNYEAYFSTSIPKDLDMIWQMLLNSKAHLLTINPDSAMFFFESETIGNEADDSFEHHLYKIQNVLGIEQGVPSKKKNEGCACEVCCVM